MARKSRIANQLATLGREVPASSVEEPSTLSPTSSCAWRVGIYARLSVKDLGIEDGDTMETQIALLRDYVLSQDDMELTEVYMDNGWTGTNFQRPEFNHLMEDVKYGKINCIVVKDLSRLGRNYLESGYYLQEVFPGYELRFIAIYDGYDSLTSDPESLLIGTKNIVNDYYSKDISRKISTALDVKRSKGPHYIGQAPYGYLLSPGDDKHYIIDKSAAPYVKMIFDWALDGYTCNHIADNLNDMQVPTPKNHYYIRNKGKGKVKLKEASDTSWTATTIKNILVNRIYAGDFVCNKSYFRKYDPANSRVIPEDEWIIYPDTHEAYISHEEQDHLRTRFQKKEADTSSMVRRSRIQQKNTDNPFVGLLFCGECNKRLRLKRSGDTTYSWSYYCAGKSTGHHPGHPGYQMSYEELKDLILFNLQVQLNTAVEIDAFLKRISLEEKKKEIKAARASKVRSLKAKQNGILNRKQRAYEDLSNGVLDSETYHMQVAKLDREFNWLTGDIERAEKRLLEVDTYFTLDNEWLRTFLSVRHQPSMDSRAIHLLIKRIEIWHDKQIHIIYNFGDWMEKLESCIRDIKET